MGSFFNKVNPEFPTRVAALAEADVYVFDDVQFVLPRVTGDQIIDQQFLVFWEKIDQLKQAGKKIVFVSALHPLHECCSAVRGIELVRLFFLSPVLELTA